MSGPPGQGGGGSPDRVRPELTSKLDYIFGRAQGPVGSRNVDRSRSMLAELHRIGLTDSPGNRAYIEKHLEQVYNDPTSVVAIQENGRVVRESLLMGPNGGVKLHTVWEGARLITVKVLRAR